MTSKFWILVLNSWKSIALPGLGFTPDSNLSIMCGGMSSVLGGAVVTEKGGSRKPAAMTRSPTDPGSHTLSIHLKSTDT